MSVTRAQRRKYVDKVERILDRSFRLTPSVKSEMRKMLNSTRRSIQEILVGQPTDWQMHHYSGLRDRVTQTFSVLDGGLTRVMKDTASGAHDRGWLDFDQLHRTFPGERLTLPLDRSMFGPLVDLSVSDLVDDVSTLTAKRIDANIKRTILGGQSPHDAIREIARELDTSDDPKKKGPAMTRAERILRTEQGTHYSVAQKVRGDQWEAERPGLLKNWLDADLNVRSAHKRAEDDYGEGGRIGAIPWGDPFVLRALSSDKETGKSLPAGEYPAMMPRDVSLPAGLRINCRCTAVPYRAEWGDL